MRSPLAHVSFWYTALGAPVDERLAAYPFAEGGDDARARALARQLRETPPNTRRPLLEVLRARASAVPFSAIHPSWLEPLLAGYPPQCRLWALGSLPASLKERLDEDRAQGDPALLASRAPAWWPAWFAADVKRRLGYPDPDPWAGDGPELPGRLWERSEAELTRLLAVHGTRGFVSGLRRLPRAEAQQWMWRLPPQCQGVAQETVERGLIVDDPFWPEIFKALEAEFPALEARLFRAALADWLRAGAQQGQDPALRRLAFRLPRRWGEWMLEALESRPAWIDMPVRPSLEAWSDALAGAMAGPPPREARA